MTILQLIEYKSVYQPREQIPTNIIHKIEREYSSQVKVNFIYQRI